MMPANRMSHIDESGEARMVDVSDKRSNIREAEAAGCLTMSAATFSEIMKGNLPKGDIFGPAKIAGIQAAKKTADLIPLCHPLMLSKVDIQFAPDETNSAINVTSFVKCTGQTGVEMEALTAVSVACLTLYDMAKALEKSMEIGPIRLIKKTGGKSDFGT